MLVGAYRPLNQLLVVERQASIKQCQSVLFPPGG